MHVVLRWKGEYMDFKLLRGNSKKEAASKSVTNTVKAKNLEQLSEVQDNTVVPPEVMRKCSIEYAGTGNILYCEEGVKLSDCRIVFHGDNSLVYFSKTKHTYECIIHIWSNSTFYIGPDSFMNRTTPMSVYAGEGRTVFIGKDALISRGIEFRTSDPHLVFSNKTHERLNPSKDVFVGDHVWLGEDALLLKGTTIGSGSIIGARALCSGKRVASNESWGGNPAKRITSGVFFTKASAHPYLPDDTEKHQTDMRDDFIYDAVADNPLFPECIADSLQKCNSAEAKLEFIQQLEESTAQDKNRFALLS